MTRVVVAPTALAWQDARAADRRHDHDALAGRWGLPLLLALPVLIGGDDDAARRALLNSMDRGALLAFRPAGSRSVWQTVDAGSLAGPLLGAGASRPESARGRCCDLAGWIGQVRICPPEWRSEGVALRHAPAAYASPMMLDRWRALWAHSGNDRCGLEDWAQSARSDLLCRLGPSGDLEAGGLLSAQLLDGRLWMPPERWPLARLGLLRIDWEAASLAGDGDDAERLWRVTVRPRVAASLAPAAKAAFPELRWTPEQFAEECRRLAQASPDTRTHDREELRGLGRRHGVKEIGIRWAFDVAFSGFPEWMKTGRRRKH